MRLRTHVIILGFLGALGICGLQSADAAVLTIYLNQATESGVRELAAAFEKATGNKVDVSFQGGAGARMIMALSSEPEETRVARNPRASESMATNTPTVPAMPSTATMAEVQRALTLRKL